MPSFFLKSFFLGVASSFQLLLDVQPYDALPSTRAASAALYVQPPQADVTKEQVQDVQVRKAYYLDPGRQWDIRISGVEKVDECWGKQAMAFLKPREGF